MTEQEFMEILTATLWQDQQKEPRGYLILTDVEIVSEMAGDMPLIVGFRVQGSEQGYSLTLNRTE